MNELFEIASGSVRGREHERLGQSSQDGSHILFDDSLILALVCDGCGSGAHSEIGAKLGGALVGRRLWDEVKRDGSRPFEEILDAARLSSLKDLRLISDFIGGNLTSVICDYLLFTIVGAIITPFRACIFSHGDGLTTVNGVTRLIDHDNMPPYLSYALVEEALEKGMAAKLGFRIVEQLPTAELDSIVLATDGFEKLLPASSSEDIVGSRLGDGSSTLSTTGSASHPSLARIWEEDCFFKNKARLTRELTLRSRDRSRVDWQRRIVESIPGILDDDTTVIAIRRRGGARGLLN